MPIDPEQSTGAGRESPRRPLQPRTRLRQALLSGTAILALLGGAVTAMGVRAETADPFAASGHPAATASVTMPDFTPIVDAVKPAVVSVSVKSRLSGASGQSNPFEGTPFEQFFRRFGTPGQGFGDNNAGPQIQRAQGSGFFISPDGYIVTNNHVVDSAITVKVTMDDGAVLDAKVVGTDKRTDLALLKVSGRSDLPFVKLSATEPKIGSWVLALGNPFGLGGTVTSGIVSAKGRDLGDGGYGDYIQIDAPVNRGNSGGPSFDLNGEVVGVNTAIYSPSGGSVGIAFDIPAATVKSVVTQLARSGHVDRGWLGVEIQPVTQAVADSLGLKTATGALVAEPQSGSPASKAGLKSGDVITAVDGKEVKSAAALSRTIANLAPDTQVTLSVLRNGQDQSVKATLGQWKDKTRQAKATPSNSGAGNEIGKLGLTVAPADTVDGAGDKGLAVLSVDPSGTAADAGVQAGDVILRVGGTDISAPDDLKSAIDKARDGGKKHVLALVHRGNSDHYVALPAPVG